jgi:hypothetical protein
MLSPPFEYSTSLLQNKKLLVSMIGNLKEAASKFKNEANPHKKRTLVTDIERLKM